MAPTWPPRQVLVNGGVAPSLMHLKRPVCAEFSEIALERAVVFRYNPQTVRWAELSTADGKKKSAGAKRENICQAPYNVREGDQLCVFQGPPQSKGMCSGDFDHAAQHSSVVVALPEDLFLRSMREEQRRERSSSTKKRDKLEVRFKARQEVTLSLGSNFDFSDEEEGADK